VRLIIDKLPITLGPGREVLASIMFPYSLSEVVRSTHVMFSAILQDVYVEHNALKVSLPGLLLRRGLLKLSDLFGFGCKPNSNVLGLFG